MNNWEEKMMDYLQGNLSAVEEAEFKQYLQTNPQAQQEINELQKIYRVLPQIGAPEPSEQLNVKFWTMLNDEKNKVLTTRSWQEKIGDFWAAIGQSKWTNRLAYTILLLVLGFGGGYWFNQKGNQVVANQQEEKMNQLVSQMNEMKEMMMLTMLEKQSASERLQAVSMSSEMKKVDDRVIEALLKTLNNDENENVRLATVESLIELVENPKVREGLIKSINKQESPLVQIALVDAMLALQEKKSVNELKKLLEKKDLNEAVKGKIESSIKVLL
jgi:HEAT repeats